MTRNLREAALEAVVATARAIQAANTKAEETVAMYAVDDALAALDAIPAADGGWRPIETAPNDGAPIIIYGGRHGVEVVLADGEWWNGPGKGKATPTHWQPLPPPPVPQSAE